MDRYNKKLLKMLLKNNGFESKGSTEYFKIKNDIMFKVSVAQASLVHIYYYIIPLYIKTRSINITYGKEITFSDTISDKELERSIKFIILPFLNDLDSCEKITIHGPALLAQGTSTFDIYLLISYTNLYFHNNVLKIEELRKQLELNNRDDSWKYYEQYSKKFESLWKIVQMSSEDRKKEFKSIIDGNMEYLVYEGYFKGEAPKLASLVPSYLESICNVKEKNKNGTVLSIKCDCGCDEFYIFKKKPNKEERQKLRENNRVFNEYWHEKGFGFGTDKNRNWVFKKNHLFMRDEVITYKPFVFYNYISVKCANCGKEYVIFDEKKHGYYALKRNLQNDNESINIAYSKEKQNIEIQYDYYLSFIDEDWINDKTIAFSKIEIVKIIGEERKKIISCDCI